MASATGFADKYGFDPFFRTEINIIALQLAKLVFLLCVIAITASVLYHDASVAVSEGINQALAPHASAQGIGTSVVDQLSSMRSRTTLIAAGVIVLVTVIFSYIITRLALAPVRNALVSQKQFIGNVAHELRTPIAIIKTNTEVALMSPNVPGDLRSTLKSTIEELDRTSEIINNLLSLSASIRPERMEFKNVDLGEVVNHVMRNLRSLAEQKHLELEARLSERRMVWGNTVALEQIVMNLIKNAVLYTPQGGRVLISIEPVQQYMEFVVQDSGVGIPRKDLFHIFEPYYRGDPSRKRGQSGSGLGLTIVSELVKLHNGKITVRSAEKRGTTVTVLLPASRKGPGFDDVVYAPTDSSEIAVDYSQHA